MNTMAFSNATLLSPTGILRDTTLTTASGRIAAIGGGVSGAVVDLGGDYLAPGFIDTQVNGGGGVLFNDQPTVDAIAAIGAAHARYGTTGFLPTLISDDVAVIARAMTAVDDAIAQGVPGVLGIHVEGPFINALRKGIHNPDKFRRLTQESIALLCSLKRGRTLVTLAPELCRPGEIARLVAGGVIVSAGHTDADYATMKNALAEGVTAFTHLFNAMSPMAHRAPGVVGAALDDRDSYCGIIIDGHHVDPVVARIAMRARPIDRFMLVTDAMPTVGSVTKSFMFEGQMIHVRDGVCVGPDGTLAGSDLDMATAVRNTVEMVGIDLEQAVVMATHAPASLLGIEQDRGSLRIGSRADLVRLDASSLAIKDVWIGGASVDALRIAA